MSAQGTATTAVYTEDHFHLLVESVRDYAIFMLDREGRVMTWNEGARRTKGYEAPEIIGTHFSRFYTAGDIASGKPQKELEVAIAEGRVEDEGWRVRKDGSVFWANVVITALRDRVTGELCGFAKVTRDLTERKNVEERLRRSEEQFRLLVENVEDYAIFLLDSEGYVVTWNAGAVRAKGYLANEIIGHHFRRFYTPEDQARQLPETLLQHAREHGSAHNQGLRVRKNGERFLADVVIKAIYDQTGSLRGYSKVTRDITEQVRNREIEAARQLAERENETKDQFLATLSHELRTPLTPVLGALAELKGNLANASRSEIEETIDIVRRNVLLEARIIDDLLDLTRISRGKVEIRREAVDVHSAVQDAVNIVNPDASAKGLVLSVELSAEEHWIWGDSTRIRQVFWNLLNNAVKFTPERGRITVLVQNCAPGRIAIEVTDTGIGLAPDQVSKIFMAFEQGEREITRQYGGLGLGLAITKKLVEMQDGSIGAQSEGRGKGSKFRVEFCSFADGNHREDASHVRSEVSTVRALRVLLVDDHADTRRILGRLLTRKGHRVGTAGSVGEALAAIEKEKWELLISDVGLPDGSGNDLVCWAKEIQPQLKSIAITGYGMDADVRRNKAAGFDVHLTKPVDFGELESQMREFFPE